MRQRGVDTIQMAIVVVAFGLLCIAAWVGHSWWEKHKLELRAEGAAVERLAWEGREREQQQAYAAGIEKLRASKDAELEKLQGDLFKAESNYLVTKKAHDAEKAKNDVVERGLRDGSIVLVDPGSATAAGKACGGQGPPDPAAVANGDGKGEPVHCRLSGQLSAFLWDEAGRADGLIKDLVARLDLAQDTVLAYYKLAVACHAAD